MLAPVIVLAVPLYDLIVVSIIRISRGKSPFVGDTNHFSHRLVARGMSRRTAVLCLYLITAATSVAAIILPHVDSPMAAVLIFCQTLLILGVVALLGFLWFNFSPAKIFMGDSGSLLIGLLLGVLTTLTTYCPRVSHGGRGGMRC